MKDKNKKEYIQEIGLDQEKLYLMFQLIRDSEKENKYSFKIIGVLKKSILINLIILINILLMPIFYYIFLSLLSLIPNIGIICFFFLFYKFLKRRYPEIYSNIEDNSIDIKIKPSLLKKYQLIFIIIGTIELFIILIISIIKSDILMLIIILGLLLFYLVSPLF